MPNELKRMFDFGKFPAYSERRINKITVEVRLQYKDNGQIVFTASGAIWNGSMTDCFSRGQNLREVFNNIIKYGTPNQQEAFTRIFRIWKKYHLNDSNAGTIKQREALEDCAATDFTERCDFLKEKGLYVDDGHTYGHGWIYDPIPENILHYLEELLSPGTVWDTIAVVIK